MGETRVLVQAAVAIADERATAAPIGVPRRRLHLTARPQRMNGTFGQCPRSLDCFSLVGLCHHRYGPHRGPAMHPCLRQGLEGERAVLSIGPTGPGYGQLSLSSRGRRGVLLGIGLCDSRSALPEHPVAGRPLTPWADPGGKAPSGRKHRMLLAATQIWCAR